MEALKQQLGSALDSSDVRRPVDGYCAVPRIENRAGCCNLKEAADPAGDVAQEVASSGMFVAHEGQRVDR